MSADEILQWWLIWLAVGGAIVLAAAALLLTIVALARRIGNLAGTAIEVVGEIEENTRPVWQLNTTNRVAGEIASGTEAAAENAEAIAAALTDRRGASAGHDN